MKDSYAIMNDCFAYYAISLLVSDMFIELRMSSLYKFRVRITIYDVFRRLLLRIAYWTVNVRFKCYEYEFSVCRVMKLAFVNKSIKNFFFKYNQLI